MYLDTIYGVPNRMAKNATVDSTDEHMYICAQLNLSQMQPLKKYRLKVKKYFFRFLL